MCCASIMVLASSSNCSEPTLYGSSPCPVAVLSSLLSPSEIARRKTPFVMIAAALEADLRVSLEHAASECWSPPRSADSSQKPKSHLPPTLRAFVDVADRLHGFSLRPAATFPACPWRM